jgi:hypothetical protein
MPSATWWARERMVVIEAAAEIAKDGGNDADDVAVKQ